MAALTASLALGACTGAREANRVAFEGVQFRSKLAKKIDGRRNQFAVAVSPVSASLEGARESARYEGIKYCIANYGSSDIEWLVGPDAPVASLGISDNTAHFRGNCAYD
ncbi:hypothetical protein E0K89_008870 [Aquicoccus sp. SCR17]|nr:hypothetical protein [Carideicomes alvinocaridis]